MRYERRFKTFLPVFFKTNLWPHSIYEYQWRHFFFPFGFGSGSFSGSGGGVGGGQYLSKSSSVVANWRGNMWLFLFHCSRSVSSSSSRYFSSRALSCKREVGVEILREVWSEYLNSAYLPQHPYSYHVCRKSWIRQQNTQDCKKLQTNPIRIRDQRGIVH